MCLNDSYFIFDIHRSHCWALAAPVMWPFGRRIHICSFLFGLLDSSGLQQLDRPQVCLQMSQHQVLLNDGSELTKRFSISLSSVDGGKLNLIVCHEGVLAVCATSFTASAAYLVQICCTWLQRPWLQSASLADHFCQTPSCNNIPPLCEENALMHFEN